MPSPDLKREVTNQSEMVALAKELSNIMQDEPGTTNKSGIIETGVRRVVDPEAKSFLPPKGMQDDDDDDVSDILDSFFDD